MKKLELVDGTIIELSDVSEKNHYVTVVTKWADIDDFNVTAENMNGAIYEGEVVDKVVFESLKAEYDGENIVVKIEYRDKTDVENIEDEQAVQNELIDELTGMEG